MAILFSADHHLGHGKIIEYSKRPYLSAAIMDSDMIARWNYKVRNNDTVYYLGDLTLGESAEWYLSRLNGYIKILTLDQHHDRKWLKLYRNTWTSKSGHPIELLPSIYTLKIEPYVFTLSHFPMWSWDRKIYGAIHLYGHVHNNPSQLYLPRSINVGVDVNDFFPVSSDEIVLSLAS